MIVTSNHLFYRFSSLGFRFKGIISCQLFILDRKVDAPLYK